MADKRFERAPWTRHAARQSDS